MTRVPKGRKKRIWDIGVLLDAFRREAAAVNLENLSWDKVIGRIGMMLLVYTCCRIQVMYNIVPQKVERNEDWKQRLIPMKTKVSAGRLKFKVLLQIMDDDGVCPVKTMEFYLRRWKDLSKEQRRFFIRKDGEPIESVRELSNKFLLPYIRNSGVPQPYTPYSAKTAVITALFNEGQTKDRIAAYSGHSNNSSTALKHYHDPTNQWLGFEVAKLSRIQIERLEEAGKL
jgi:hypothetical protein